MNIVMEMSGPQLIALGLAAVACGWDVRTRRIPQAITLGGALAAFAFHAVVGGWSGAALSVSGWALGLAIFFVPFALGGLGAGDVKLLGALGAWVGPGDVIWLALYAGVAGGVLAVVVSLARGYLSTALANVHLLTSHWMVNGVRPLNELTLEHSHGPRLAYAVPILAGTMVRLLWLH
jgi:prepilin peptidase CpaA